VARSRVREWEAAQSWERGREAAHGSIAGARGRAGPSRAWGTPGSVSWLDR
jgi:hypothetical protein